MNDVVIKATGETDLANVLLCRTHPNHIRWTPGERLHHLFEQICDALAAKGLAAHPAVDSPSMSLSYAALEAETNRLARRLLAEGYGPGDVIALMFDRSALSYIALLAVSKINAAYVPLDPAFPLDRVEFIAQDAGVSAILTLDQFADALVDASVPVLALDAPDEAKSISEYAPDRLTAEETPEPVSELSYIIYTSGSTGRPKGVPIEQASICNFLRVAAETYGYDHTDRVYQGLTLAFDFSVEEILVPMMVGATLVPNQSGGSLVGADLGAFLKEKRVTAMCCVPTLLATIETELPDLRLLIVSGEACPQEVMARWCTGGRRMLNAYGPTETTVTCTVQELTPGEPVTIGGPLPTYSAVVLAPDQKKMLAFGETGELCIGGVGLSPGYLNRDDKTKAAFIDDFIGLPENPSGKIYRTGDLVRINEIGRIEYLGRIDTQVKIRGYRIELSEIESVIMQSPFVAQAVVNPFEPEAGVKELVAYYTIADGVEGRDEEEVMRAIARQAKEALPPFMQPAFWEPLDTIPLLPSDKADRKSLPKPTRPRLTMAGGAYEAPATEMEQLLERELGALLGLERVSAVDDFFDDLGANSLQMARFSARLRDGDSAAEASMRDLYAHRSIRSLAAFLQERSGQSAEPLSARPHHVASDAAYYAFGVAQFSLGFLAVYGGLEIFFWMIGYFAAAVSFPDLFLRALEITFLFSAVSLALPIAVKWLLWGSFREEEFPIWSSRHFRFWFVKSVMQANPWALATGTPLYIAYLKALGAKVSWNAAIFTNRLPAPTDLISIGSGAILRPNSMIYGWKAEAGYIRIGAIEIGEDAYIGEGSVLDINTRIGARAELAHASCLHEGGSLEAGRVYHGSPAEPADPALGRYNSMPWSRVSTARKIWYSAFLVGAPLLLTPLAVTLLFWLYLNSDDAGVFNQPSDLFAISLAQNGLSIIAATASLYLTGLVLGGLLMALWPRFWWLFLRKDKTYKLYGIAYILYGFVKGGSTSKFYNQLFGDSAFIVGWLRWIGYRFTGGVEQSGSNFGVDQRHDVPFLCEVRRGAMVSDGLEIRNTEISAGRFRLREAVLPADSFFGNSMVYPAANVMEENCLYGTKTMVPTRGEKRSNTGLLGSPPFEIPRSSKRDLDLTSRMTEQQKAAALTRKNRHNLATMALFVMARLSLTLTPILVFVFFVGDLQMLSPLGFALGGLLGASAYIALKIFYERLTLGFGKLEPKECAILDPYFAYHERVWKLSVWDALQAFNETPLKGFLYRCAGVKVGRRLYDAGGGISEKTLTEIGDDCCLNIQSSLQAHSLEDGAFKSDHIVIGDRVTLGVNAFVHYGTRVGSGAEIRADAFFMKGAEAPEGSVWRGNPASLTREGQIEKEREALSVQGSQTPQRAA